MRALLCTALLLIGCRPDPGSSDYENQEQFEEGQGPGATSSILPGPDPFMEGDRRLTIGKFYEGARSEDVPIDGVSSHFYVYEDTFTAKSSDSRVEGQNSDLLQHSGALPWWGGGVHWGTGRDLSEWTSLHISLRSRDAAFADVDIAVHDGMDDMGVALRASDYGYSNDDTWHNLTIPLTDFTAAGLDSSVVIVPLRLGGGAGDAGERLLVDNVYYDVD